MWITPTTVERVVAECTSVDCNPLLRFVLDLSYRLFSPPGFEGGLYILLVFYLEIFSDFRQTNTEPIFTIFAAVVELWL